MSAISATKPARQIGSARVSASRSACSRGAAGFPILFAEAARRQGCRSPAWESSTKRPTSCATSATRSSVVGVAKLGRMIRAFRRRGVERIVMAGKVTKNVIYTPWRILQLCPDLRTFQWWYRRNRADNRDDSLLLSSHRRVRARRDDVCLGPGLLPGAARERRHSHPPAPTSDASERTSSSAGRWPRRWAGSTSASRSPSRSRRRLAVEAIEGTDRCIERAGQLCRAGGWSLVKVAKPQQDMRFDVPTIGVTTIENLHKAGARVLAIEAGKTILLDQPEVVALADRYGLSIVAIS